MRTVKSFLAILIIISYSLIVTTSILAFAEIVNLRLWGLIFFWTLIVNALALAYAHRKAF